MASQPTSARPAKTDNPIQNLRFEDAVAELETIIRNMENGGNSLDLETAMTAYQRGMDLLKHCQAQLADAETRVRILSLEDSGDGA